MQESSHSQGTGDGEGNPKRRLKRPRNFAANVALCCGLWRRLAPRGPNVTRNAACAYTDRGNAQRGGVGINGGGEMWGVER